jgi:hypothetical protein
MKVANGITEADCDISQILLTGIEFVTRHFAVSYILHSICKENDGFAEH